MQEKIILIGGGGHCKSCIDVLEQEGRFAIAGIVDLPEKVGEEILGYPIIGTDDDLPDLLKTCPHVLITLGQIKSPNTRIRLYERLLELGFKLPGVISPFAYVSPHAQIGEGAIIMHHALVNAGARIGRNCIINTKALVEHDAVIEDHCHTATGAIINGGVTVGTGTFVGSNAVIKEGIMVDHNCVIGCGVTITKTDSQTLLKANK